MVFIGVKLAPMVTEPMIVVLGIVLLFAALLFVYRCGAKRRRFINMVNQLPGPPTVPILGNALEDFTERNQIIKIANERVEKYGPIFRTWMGSHAQIHITRPEHAEVILGTTKHIKKTLNYMILREWLGRGLLTGSGKRWHLHRKLITPTFHFKILESFFSTFNEKSEILVKNLQKQVDIFGENGFDVYPFIASCTLDILCQTAMGVDVRAQDNTNSEYVRAVYELAMYMTQRALRPWLHKQWIFQRTTIGKNFQRCLNILHGFAEQVIKERKAEFFRLKSVSCEKEDTNSCPGTKRRLAFLDLLLEASQNGSVMTDVDIREEVDTVMFAGHDTTSVGLSWALYLIGLHPQVQVKVVEELDTIFEGSDRPVTSKDVVRMKYLERVLKETMRLYTNVPFIGRYAEQDIVCGNYTIPAGSQITIQLYHIHRCADQFPNPEVFDPDNFLPDRIQGRHPYAYIPFSAGPRNCVGQKYAMLEEKVVLATVLRRFSVRSIEESKNIRLISEMILRSETGIQLVLTPKNKS